VSGVRRPLRGLGLSGPRLLRALWAEARRAAAGRAVLLLAVLAGAAPAPPDATITPATPGGSPAPAASPAEPVRVRFVEPAPPGLILGPTRITIEASTGGGASIVAVSLYADGVLLTSFEKPPYTVTWDAGSRFVRRVLRAVATDSEGREGEATLVARPLFIGQHEEVRLVSVYATVRDRRGEPVTGLGRDDFVLEEDGVAQTITHFTSAGVPLAVALLIDASNSMNLGGKIDFARRAAEDFVASVESDDRLSVAWFNDRLQGLEAPVADRKSLKEAIASIAASGGTALYDAVYKTAARLEDAEGRRAIVLLSDGRDQAEADNEPGSLHLFEEALEKAHRSEVAVYAVGLGRHLDSEMDLQDARSLKEILETFARQTGGRAYFPERPGDLSGIYRQIASDLKHQYVIAYSPTNRARDGRWRRIALRTRNPEHTVQARAGYYAPGGA
jgi:Ca-activated chloride channel family protein